MRRALALLAACSIVAACSKSPTSPSTSTGPLFTASGAGDMVLTMPSSVTQLRVTGTYTGSSANFIIWLGPSNVACDLVTSGGCSLLVNELLGTSFGRTTFTGMYQVGGAGRSIQIVKSSGVAWTFTEVR